MLLPLGINLAAGSYLKLTFVLAPFLFFVFASGLHEWTWSLNWTEEVNQCSTTPLFWQDTCRLDLKKIKASTKLSSCFMTNPEPRQQVSDGKIIIYNWRNICESCRKCMFFFPLDLNSADWQTSACFLQGRKCAFALHAWTKIPPPELSWQMRQIKSCNRRGKELSRQISRWPFIHKTPGHKRTHTIRQIVPRLQFLGTKQQEKLCILLGK